jgi:hypothetical protein
MIAIIFFTKQSTKETSMNKFNIAFVKAFTLAFAIMVGALIVGCKSTTEPTANEEYDSEAAADITAASLGTESGGAGNNFADVQNLVNGNDINGIVPGKSNPMSRSAQYDSVTGKHTITVYRGKTLGKYQFSDSITYVYIYYDASGAFMKNFQKGVTDAISVSFTKARSRSVGDRLDVDADAAGNWKVTNIISGPPLFNGTFTRSGTEIFHTEKNGDRTFTHSFNIAFINDTIVKNGDHVYLEGPAESHFEATTPKYNFARDTKIVFNGDGTAFLDIKRTSGDGSTDEYTIDVKVGFWKWKGKH